jgi:V/A-type H+-transporting ATPase subunit G/H
MARDDILSRIKGAEAQSKAGVQQAVEERDKKAAAATAEAANIVKTAEAESQDYYDKSLAKADSDVKAKKQSIVQAGSKDVSALSSSANAKLDKAVDYLMKEFMGLLNA